MGFLDHSSTNITVDAVLTDTGRQFLAKNDGSFKVVYFSLGDDEIDYSIIKKFGRVIGKNKIELNTPIFEAQTNSAYAIKYECTTANNPDLKYFPNLALSSPTSNFTLTDAMSSNSKELTFEIKSNDPSLPLDTSLADSVFLVKLPNMFVSINGSTPDHIDSNGVAYYRIQANTSTSTPTCKFTVVKRSISASQYNIYGDGSTIKAAGVISGLSSGASLIFSMTIAKS